MRTALLSASNKAGLTERARALQALDFSFLASEGTGRVLRAADLPVQDVSEFVGGKPILGHRVVTLSREIHAGLLARDTTEDREELDRLGIPRIDLVFVDLYPLGREVAKPDSTIESIREMTDIGGPALLRAAAKGRRIVISDAEDWDEVLEWIKFGQPDEAAFLDELAARAELVCAQYALESARAIGNHRQGLSVMDGFVGVGASALAYGENPWQQPAHLLVPSEVRKRAHPDTFALTNFQQVAGASLSYNNYCDFDRLLQTMTHLCAGFDMNPIDRVRKDLTPLIAVGVKHGNACGVGVGGHHQGTQQLVRSMILGSPEDISGGWVMTNFPIHEEEASVLVSYEGKRILDGVVAPAFRGEAIKILDRKKGGCRMLVHPDLGRLDRHSLDTAPRFRYVRGGMLRQPNYTYILDLNDPELDHWGEVNPSRNADFLLAWAVGSTSTSNTITLAKHGMLIGNGVGQTSRVSAAELAIHRARRAGHDVTGAVAYSDSFFPFSDGVQTLIDAGVAGILATRGSIRDNEVIAICVGAGIPLYALPNKKARGFYGH